MAQGKRKRDEVSQEMPEELRRRDQPQADAPEAVPRPDEETGMKGVSPPEDGGVEQHPIHDDDIEDLQPEDYEEMIDAVDDGGFESVDPPGKR
jgi:hypothetical protein